MNRTKRSFYNVTIETIGHIAFLFISFLVRRIFIQYLGATYLGVDAMFTNILSILSLAELGLSASITFALYKPLAAEDEDSIKSLIKVFKKAYKAIGLFIFISGILLIPILSYIIEFPSSITNLYLVYILYLLETSIGYLFSYKRTILLADQKAFMNSIFKYGFGCTYTAAQILILIITKNFILYVLVRFIFTIIEGASLTWYVNRQYPYLKQKDVEPLKKPVIAEIKKNIKAMFMHKIGFVFVSASDNIIISIYDTLIGVALYSNYLLLIQAVKGIFSQLFYVLTPTVGNIGANNEIDNLRQSYHQSYFLCFWVNCFAATSLFCLLNPFITIWLGKDFLFSMDIVFILVLNVYLDGIRTVTVAFRDGLGLFYYDRYKPIAEAIIKLLISIILVRYLGILGVLIGTTISIIATSFWIEPLVLYKYGLKMPVKKYFLNYFMYIGVTLCSLFLTHYLVSLITGTGILRFFIKSIICIVTPNILVIFLFYKNKDFRGLSNKISDILLHKKVFK
jgi:hypothetical protein